MRVRDRDNGLDKVWGARWVVLFLDRLVYALDLLLMAAFAGPRAQNLVVWPALLIDEHAKWLGMADDEPLVFDCDSFCKPSERV